MLDSLFQTEKPLREILLESEAEKYINCVDFEALKVLKNVLEPVELAVKNLSDDDTLSSANVMIKFMLQKLLDIDHEISRTLHDNIKRRIGERINNDVMNLLPSLKDPSISPSKYTLIFAASLAYRLFCRNNLKLSNDAEERTMQLQEELNLKLQESTTITNAAQDKFKWLKNHLQKLYDALLSIKPTSTDVERVFSVTSSIPISSRFLTVSLSFISVHWHVILPSFPLSSSPSPSLHSTLHDFLSKPR
ncbi:hypothetical protein ACJMK2_025757 [Sinanodonta woodiana]|uniref:HAT C-terminal dimerisation domain-containing protein n=1 Tax=Sinanodonta woodiana TaxID=1069815 RepID=A0ABD3XHG2_SINWO